MASACGISQLQTGGRLLPKLFWWLKWKRLLAAASQPLKNQPLCSLWHFSQWLLHLWGASDGPGDHNTNMCLSAAGLWLLSYCTCRSQMTFLIESESNCGVSCHYRDHDANMCLSAVWPWAEYAWKSCYACSWFSTKTLPKILFCESNYGVAFSLLPSIFCQVTSLYVDSETNGVSCHHMIVTPILSIHCRGLSRIIMP